MIVEKVIIAEEIKKVSPKLLTEVKKLLEGIPIQFVAHEKFKTLTHQAKGIVRSREITPYANIILISGVNF